MVEVTKGMKMKAFDAPMGAIVHLGCGCTHRKVPMPMEQIARALRAGHTYAQAQNGINYPWFKIVTNDCGQPNCQFEEAKRGHSGWCFDELEIVKPPTEADVRRAGYAAGYKKHESDKRIIIEGDDLWTKMAKAAEREMDLEQEIKGYRAELKDLIDSGKVTPDEVLAREEMFPKHVLYFLFEFQDKLKKALEDADQG